MPIIMPVCTVVFLTVRSEMRLLSYTGIKLIYRFLTVHGTPAYASQRGDRIVDVIAAEANVPLCDVLVAS